MDNNSVTNAVTEEGNNVNKAMDDIRKALEQPDDDHVLELTDLSEEVAAPLTAKNNAEEPLILEEAVIEAVPAPVVAAPTAVTSFEEGVTKAEKLTEPTIPVKEPAVSKQVANQLNNKEVETLVAPEVADASQKILKSYMQAAGKGLGDNVNFRSGASLEDLVVEMIKPEISEWLNKNLTHIVESVIEKEIKKIIPNK